MSKWNDESVKQELQKNPCFQNLEKEFSGKFICYYFIDGVQIIIYNEMGGSANAYFCFWDMDADISEAQKFARIAVRIINALINENSYK